jgi:RNA polymerase sigma-70 factor (ECF subfamily)
MASPAPDWQEWYDAHAARLVLYARQWLPETADAEDAVQAGFVRFWRSKARPAAADLPLLFTAVRTAALDLAKSRRRLRQREAKAAAEGGTAWWDADTLAEQERAAAVQRAVESLPPEQREAVVLRIWGGLTFAEAARTLGANINTVVSRYRGALATLRKHLPETCHEADR